MFRGILLISLVVYFGGCTKPHFYDRNSMCNELSHDLNMIESEFDTITISYKKLKELRTNVDFCKKQVNLSQSDYEKFDYLDRKLTRLEKRWNDLSNEGDQILRKPIESLN